MCTCMTKETKTQTVLHRCSPLFISTSMLSPVSIDQHWLNFDLLYDFTFQIRHSFQRRCFSHPLSMRMNIDTRGGLRTPARTAVIRLVPTSKTRKHSFRRGRSGDGEGGWTREGSWCGGGDEGGGVVVSRGTKI